jgi:hypothetical protein
MAIYTFYDTDSFPSNVNADNTNALVTLWGSTQNVRWLTVSPLQLASLNHVNMLEISLSNLLPISNINLTFLTRNLTPAESIQRESRRNNPSKEQIIIKLLKEGNAAKFRFRLHQDLVKNVTNNFTHHLEFTLGLFDGQLSLFIKASSTNQAIVAFGVSLPSGGVKIPKGQ